MKAIEMKPFMKIDEACQVTGLSRFYLRRSVREGTIPHIKSGTVYYINMAALMEQHGIPFTVEIGGEAGPARRGQEANGK